MIIAAFRRYNILMIPVVSALEALSQTLEARGLRYELVAVGGTSLLLLGLIDRPTRDLDVVATVEAGRYHALPDLPSPLAEAVRDVGEVMGIGPNWLNSGPAGLLDFGLPEGFAERAEIRSYGALTLHVASRVDQIALKLYAAADQGLTSKHMADLRGLTPTGSELLTAARWTRTHDPSPGFAQELRVVLRALGVDDDVEL